jgi:hypothetical protein
MNNIRYLGGFSPPMHGFVLGRDVTAAFGWGAYAGQLLFAAGHVDEAEFLRPGNFTRLGNDQVPLPARILYQRCNLHRPG